MRITVRPSLSYNKAYLIYIGIPVDLGLNVFRGIVGRYQLEALTFRNGHNLPFVFPQIGTSIDNSAFMI